MKIIILIMIGISLLRAEYIRDDAKELVLDTKTNLIWQDNIKLATSWENAISYCKGSTFGGYNDWRVPNFNELYHLSDRSIYNPAINPVFKNIINEKYWSSTTFVAGDAFAWYVDFSDGVDGTNAKTANYYIRCVR